MNPPDSNFIDRKPAVAGQFYPDDTAELKRMISGYFTRLKNPEDPASTIAIISPHAGYVYSGEVAAAAFNQLDPQKEYTTVFIIGSSHRASFGGGSIYTAGNFITPFGTVPVDLETAKTLAASNKYLSFDPHYQRNEHSIEVQVPFLQYYLKKPFRIVPILLGTQDASICKSIAKTLEPYLNLNNVFVISTDFSHYPDYENAVKIDKIMADAILSNKPGNLIEAELNCLKKPASNLATGCCSWPAVITLMYMTEGKPVYDYSLVMYRNSGDSRYGDHERVVGYNAIRVKFTGKHETGFNLSETDKKELLAIARNTIREYLANDRVPDLDRNVLPPALQQNAGAFVTLRKNGELRGCIGHFEADNSLYSIVQQMAVASSTQDHRFSPVTSSELKDLDLEISVLTPMKKISSVSEIVLGRDGIYISKGGRGGTFLPQVATETGWNLEEFLGHCARDKAGIGWYGWKDKDTEIFTYQALVFHE
jgi:AmmeMemoRadiSam system protein B/AmmeMemoRadiSam system protein A